MKESLSSNCFSSQYVDMYTAIDCVFTRESVRARKKEINKSRKGSRGSVRYYKYVEEMERKGRKEKIIKIERIIILHFVEHKYDI